jgi:hypothetical protein
MSTVNIFICQTPFQSFISSQLCKNFFQQHTNIFISSVPQYTHYPGKTLIIHNGLINKLKGLWSAKLFLNKMARVHGENLQIFLPHVDGILGNYLFNSENIASRGVKLNFFYEGVVMLDSSRDQRIFPRNIFKKRLLSIFLFVIFKKFKDILPVTSPRVHKIYTPHIQKTPGPKNKMELIKFPKSSYEVVPGRCIIIGLDAWYDIERLYLNLFPYIEANTAIKEVLFKPHYSDRLKVFQKLAEEKKFDYKIIQSNFCIEEIIAEYKPQFVVSPYLSSALINLKFMYDAMIEIICVSNESALVLSGKENLEFAEASGIQMIISQSNASAN